MRVPFHIKLDGPGNLVRIYKVPRGSQIKKERK